MAYTILEPSARLAPFVETLWVQELEELEIGHAGGPTQILPVGRSEFVVDYGDPFARVRPDREERIPRLMWLGQRTEPIPVRATGRTGLIIVGFRPWASSLFAPADELAGEMTDLFELERAAVCRRLEDAALTATSSAERVRIVESFLVERLEGLQVDARMLEAVRRLHDTHGRLGIEELAGELGTSRRHLVRLFRGAIGIPPKTFARILRFQHASTLRRLGHSWSHVAQAAGFVDQAHLTRDMRELCGETPGQIDRRVDSTPLTRFYNSSDPSRICNTVYL